ncbi:MAG: phage antirepressor [Ruminococcus sp.]
MNEIKVWNYESSEVRTIEKDGEPWFVLSDVCKVLELSSPHKVADRLEDDERNQIPVTDSIGRNQNTTIINESGLYAVILRSDKPQAKPFRKWVTSEVLPSIRKHGAYLTDNALEQALTNPDFLIQLAKELKTEKEKRLQLEQQAEENKPKVLFADSVAASKSSILVREFAKICKQNGIEVGEKRLFEWLRENGYLIRKVGSDYNAPTQRAMEQGLFEVKETAVTHASGRISTERTPKITGKGQIFFLNKLKAVAESNAGVLDADWRSAADQRIKAYTKEHKINHMKFRKDLYESLEAAFGIKFVDLLELLKAKKKKEGWTYRQRATLTNLDVIANNEALKEQFDCMMLEVETGQMALA